MSATAKTLSRSNGSNRNKPHAKTPKPATRNGDDSAPADQAAAHMVHGGFDSPWLGALPYRWRAQRPD